MRTLQHEVKTVTHDHRSSLAGKHDATNTSARMLEGGAVFNPACWGYVSSGVRNSHCFSSPSTTRLPGGGAPLRSQSWNMRQPRFGFNPEIYSPRGKYPLHCVGKGEKIVAVSGLVRSGMNHEPNKHLPAAVLSLYTIDSDIAHSRRNSTRLNVGIADQSRANIHRLHI